MTLDVFLLPFAHIPILTINGMVLRVCCLGRIASSVPQAGPSSRHTPVNVSFALDGIGVLAAYQFRIHVLLDEIGKEICSGVCWPDSIWAFLHGFSRKGIALRRTWCEACPQLEIVLIPCVWPSRHQAWESQRLVDRLVSSALSTMLAQMLTFCMTSIRT